MTKIINLTKNQVTVVDDDDYPNLNKYKWYTATSGKYLYAGIKTSDGKLVLMHRQIMGFPSYVYIDHIDGDGLNNRRSNLRLVNNSLNQLNRHSQVNNTSGYRGVYLHKLSGKWEARFRIEGKNYYLGLFDTPEVASLAYEYKRKEVVGII